MVEREADKLPESNNGYRSLAEGLKQLDTSFLPIPSTHPDKINYGGGFYFDPQEERMVFCDTCSKNGQTNGHE